MGGIASRTTVGIGCTHIVSSGGSARGTTVSSGGSQIVSSGGSALGTTVSGGTLQVDSGSLASNTVINSKGCEIIYSGGTARGTGVGSGGTQIVSSGGSALGTTVSSGGTLFLMDGASAGGEMSLGGTMDVKGSVTFSAGTVVMLNVSGRSASDGHMVTGLTALPGNVTWCASKSGRSGGGVTLGADPGTYRLVEGFEGMGDFSFAINDTTWLTVNNSIKFTGDGLWYALSAVDGLCLTVAETDPLYTAPDPVTISVSDARLNQAVIMQLPDGVTISQPAINEANDDISYGKFSLRGRDLVFTQTKGYTHAANETSASDTHQLTVTNMFGKSVNMDVTLTITDSTPTLSVAALSASVPSGTAKSGKWSSVSGDALATLTVGGNTLNLGTSTNSISVAGNYGTLTVKADGTYSYAAKDNAVGTDSFAFAIKDADGDSANATLKVAAIDKTAPTNTSMSQAANAIGATLQFSEKMDVSSIKSALTATLTGTGAKITPTAVKETNAATHTYSATFSTGYVGAYRVTLGAGAKDLAGNALGRGPSINVPGFTVMGRTVAAKAKQTVYSGGIASACKVSGQQLVYSGGKAVKSVINKGGKLVLNKGGHGDYASISAGATVTVKAGGKSMGAKIGGTSKLAGTMTVAGSAASTTVKAYGALTVSGGTASKVSVQKNGTLTLTKGSVKALTLASGGKVQINGGKLAGTTNLKGGTLTVAATGVKVAAIKAAKSAVISLDLRKVKAGAKDPMLVAGAKSTLKNSFSILTNKLQALGSYKLSSAKLNVKDASFTVKAGSVAVKGLKLGGSAVVKNGVSYTVSTVKKVTTLKLGVGAGSILNKDGKTIKGTANSDIFYAGPGKNTISGVNGRDVAVYDKNAWGKDTIAKTKGTMTLVLQGLKKSAVTTKLSGTTMTIAKKADKAQKITIKGWSADTHNIVYNVAAADLKAFTNYRAAASPTEAQKQAAQNSVFKAAKLA
jgi:autotransporter passenger strand-loop-strand repeat protein/VCBS repeat-containing protein